MKKKFILFIVLAVMPLSFAYALTQPIVNRIDYQLSAQKWVSTKDVMVVVGVHTSVANINVASVQRHIFEKLQHLLPSAKWHVIKMVQGSDQAGLSTLALQVQSRVKQSSIANLQQQMKSLSKAGEKFQLLSLDFQPSQSDVEQAYGVLRAHIYQQVQAELTHLNRAFPKQHYFVHQINFNQTPIVTPRPMLYGGASNNFLQTFKQNNATVMPVSRQLTLTAKVELASIRSA